MTMTDSINPKTVSEVLIDHGLANELLESDSPEIFPTALYFGYGLSVVFEDQMNLYHNINDSFVRLGEFKHVTQLIECVRGKFNEIEA